MSPKNDPGYGKDYEFLTPALFALRLFLDENVKNFTMESNVNKFGNLDDLILIIQYTNGEEHKFVFQLKHRENDKTLIQACSFEVERGDFSLNKYFQGYNKIPEKRSNYHYILYTNKVFSTYNLAKVSKFKMSQKDNCPAMGFALTDPNRGNVFHFQVNSTNPNDRFEEFLDKFSLYVGQGNWKTMRNEIRTILKEKFHTEAIFLGYLNIFTQWHNKEYVNGELTREIIQTHLLDLLLSPHIIKPSGQNHGRKFALLQEVFKEHNLTLIRNPGSLLDIGNIQQELACDKKDDLLNLAKQRNFLTKDVQTLPPDTMRKILWYFLGEPIFVTVKADTKNLIFNTITLCQSPTVNFVIILNNLDNVELPDFTFLETLHDISERNPILCNAIMDEFRISLQGRVILLKELMELDRKMLEFIRIEHLVQMMDDGCLIGKNIEELPEYYVPRHVTTTLIAIEIINNITDSAIGIECRGKDYNLQLQFLNSKLKVKLNLKSFDEETLLLVHGDPGDNISSHKRIHRFALFGEDKLEWISSSGNIAELKSQRGKISQHFIHESEIFHHFKNPVILICARPGMGKSTMVKYLRNHTPPDYWTIKVDLKSSNEFFKEAHSHEEIVEHFFNIATGENANLSNKIRQWFKDRLKIMWFFDGVDELQADHIKFATKAIKEISSKGYRVVFASRPNFQDLLENEFNVFAIDIAEFSADKQREYVKNRLSKKLNELQVNNVIGKIYDNINHINNNTGILGVPLQLFMLTQIFIEDQDNKLLETGANMFILTRMYHHFFDGKYQHYLLKINADHPHLLEDLEDRLECYKLPALQSCLDEDTFKSLGLNAKKPLEKFRIKHEKKGDIIGIISKIVDGHIIFDHNSYAEYFAAEYLAENFDEISDKTFLFHPKYDNIRLLFDMKLGEESPAHLAILYRDVCSLTSSEMKRLDLGGRSPLHLVCSYGTKMPLIEVILNEKGYKIGNQYKIEEIKRDIIHEKMLDIVLNSNQCNPLDLDEVFNWTALQYADFNLSLFSINAISKSRDIDLAILQNYQHLFTVMYYAIYFGCDSLLKIVIGTPLFLDVVNKKNLNIFGRSETLLHVAAENGHGAIVELLLEAGADFRAVDENGSAAMHRAAFEGYKDIVAYLRKAGADVDAVDSDGQTALHLAALNGHIDVVVFLKDIGANVNVLDRSGKSALLLAQENIAHSSIIEVLLQ